MESSNAGANPFSILVSFLAGSPNASLDVLVLATTRLPHAIENSGSQFAEVCVRLSAARLVPSSSRTGKEETKVLR
jgi:hypothetical protein